MSEAYFTYQIVPAAGGLPVAGPRDPGDGLTSGLGTGLDQGSRSSEYARAAAQRLINERALTEAGDYLVVTTERANGGVVSVRPVTVERAGLVAI